MKCSSVQILFCEEVKLLDVSLWIERMFKTTHCALEDLKSEPT